MDVARLKGWLKRLSTIHIKVQMLSIISVASLETSKPLSLKRRLKLTLKEFILNDQLDVLVCILGELIQWKFSLHVFNDKARANLRAVNKIQGEHFSLCTSMLHLIAHTIILDQVNDEQLEYFNQSNSKLVIQSTIVQELLRYWQTYGSHTDYLEDLAGEYSKM